jgi:hypothetical protein
MQHNLFLFLKKNLRPSLRHGLYWNQAHTWLLPLARAFILVKVGGIQDFITHIVKDVMVVFREAFHPSIRPIIQPLPFTFL